MLAGRPADPAALVRYAAEAPWCAGYAKWTRRAGKAYAVPAVAAVVVCHRAAYTLHVAVGAGSAWTPGVDDPDVGPVVRLAARCPAPPSLSTVAAGTSSAHPAPRAAVLAATGFLYALAFLMARPGRVLAAFLLFVVLLIFL